MAAIPVTNPQLPFMGYIPGGLTHGRMIRINGFMLPDADRVSINLQTGPSIQDNEPFDDDVCLHIDIRAEENEIVRNHFGPDGWGYEEKCENTIQPGSNFEIIILAQLDCFKIAVNGRHLCEFKHRLPLDSAQYLFVCRDANIFSITLEGDVPNNAQNASAPPLAGGYGQPQMYNPDAAALSYQGGPY